MNFIKSTPPALNEFLCAIHTTSEVPKKKTVLILFVKALPAMKKLCKTTSPPFIDLVSRDSKITLIKKFS